MLQLIQNKKSLVCCFPAAVKVDRASPDALITTLPTFKSTVYCGNAKQMKGLGSFYIYLHTIPSILYCKCQVEM